MKTKATQAADDSLGTSERTSIKEELAAMAKQINLETVQATWNSRSLFAGTASANATAGNVLFKFQSGAGNSSTNDSLQFNLLKTGNVSLDSGNMGFSAYGLRLDAVSPGGTSSTRLGGGTLTGSLEASGTAAMVLRGRRVPAAADVSE